MAALRETRARAQTARATRADARRAARNKVVMKIMHILHLFWLYEKLCFRWLRLVKVVQRLFSKFKSLVMLDSLDFASIGFVIQCHDLECQIPHP